MPPSSWNCEPKSVHTTLTLEFESHTPFVCVLLSALIRQNRHGIGSGLPTFNSSNIGEIQTETPCAPCREVGALPQCRASAWPCVACLFCGPPPPVTAPPLRPTPPPLLLPQRSRLRCRRGMIPFGFAPSHSATPIASCSPSSLAPPSDYASCRACWFPGRRSGPHVTHPSHNSDDSSGRERRGPIAAANGAHQSSSFGLDF